MKNNLTNEQIARVFAMYWGQHILIVDLKEKHEVDYITMRSFKLTGERFKMQYKLLLTPLSAISDEDANEVRNIIWGCEIRRRNIVNIQYVVENLWHTDLAMGTAFLIYQYLIQQGYAVPLFIAPNHPDNGKDAIELGLAIDKTKTPQ